MASFVSLKFKLPTLSAVGALTKKKNIGFSFGNYTQSISVRFAILRRRLPIQYSRTVINPSLVKTT